MGIGGHILGPKKLRRLSRLTGLALERAYTRDGDSEGIVWNGDDHIHYRIDPYTGEHRALLNPNHWASCRLGVHPADPA